MLDDFLIRAGLAGLGLAIASGPLGAFVVWRRMAYFGDATAHAAVLGVALALALELPVAAGVAVSAAAMALAVSSLAGRGLAIDTLLGALAHSALALGVLGVSLAAHRAIDLEALLFGDILATTRGDLALVWGGALLVLLLLRWRWSAMLTATVSEELASASGIDPRRERMILALALALLVAAAIKVVGALLVTAMLILPAAAARPFAKAPEAMALGAALAGALSVGIGLRAAWALDAPAGPAIVVAAAALFALSRIAAAARG